jgi:hypothetical protein
LGIANQWVVKNGWPAYIYQKNGCGYLRSHFYPVGDTEFEAVTSIVWMNKLIN